MTEQQVTFLTRLNSERKLEFQIPPNRSVETEDKPRLSRQAKVIFELLQSGPATTSELAAIGLQYNARINEVRHAIVKLGLMVDETEGFGGQNEYRIVELDQSTFWQRLKEKGEQWRWL